MRKIEGEEKFNAVLTRGKVLPQMNVSRSRESSAFRDGVIT
jgi:hypothetical protein